MAENHTSLAAEIERIVDCPYPTQLKSLRDLLVRDSAAADIRQWTLAKPCQIPRLVSCVLDGLRQWPYVLEIVEKLCCNATLRDAFLAEEPQLLPDIVTQAVRANNVQSGYTAAAVALLSTRLPPHTPIPADAQALFVRLFEYAAQNPSIATIKPAYQLLHGSSSHLLELLSSRTLVKLEDQIFEILRSNKGDTSPLSLYCLAILRVLLASSDEDFSLTVSSYDTQELLASTQLTSSRWTPNAVRQFFHDSKAQRTVQLVVLRTMWACTISTGDLFDERLESVKLANDIIRSAPLAVKDEWRKPNALYLRKLEEKVQHPDLPMALRFSGLSFLLQLYEGSHRPSLIAAQLRAILVKPMLLKELCWNNESQSVRHLIDQGIFDQSTTTTLLQNLVDFITTASPEDMVELSTPLRLLSEGLAENMPHDDQITEGTMLALDVLACGDKLQRLARQVKTSTERPGTVLQSQICDQTLNISFNGLAHALTKVFLTASLSSHQSNYSLSQATQSLLLDTFASSAPISAQCSHARPLSRTEQRPFIEATSTPENANGPVDWRQSLRQGLRSRVEHEHAQISTILERAVCDLERRCESVEQPLLLEHQKLQALQVEYDKLKMAYSELESEGLDRDIRCEAIEVELERDRIDTEHAKAEARELADRVEELEVELQRQRSDQARNAEDTDEDKRAMEVQHAAVLARKEEQLEEAQDKLRQTLADIHAKVDEIESLQRNLHKANEKIQELEAGRHHLEELDREQSSALVRLRAEYNKVNDQRLAVEDQLAAAEEATKAAADKHTMNLNALQEQTRLQMQQLEEAKSEEKSRLETVLAGMREALSQARAEVDRLHEVEEQQSARLQRREQRLADMQKKIDRLQREGRRKDKELAEASAIKDNVMALLRQAGAQRHTQHSTQLPYRPSLSSFRPTAQEMDSQEDLSPPTPTSADGAASQELGTQASFVSNASSNESRSGPTPKRAKSARVSIAPAITRTRLSTASARTTRSSLRGLQSAKRQALTNISGNPAARVAGPKTPIKGFDRDMDETTFDGSEGFAGTPGADMLEVQERLA